MAQDPFWHPVMGAVDFMTQDVIRQRDARRRENLQRESWDRQDARNRLNQQVGLYGNMARTPGITPESRSSMYGAAQGLLQGNPVEEQPQIEVQRVRLPKEVEDYFTGYIQPGQLLPLNVAKNLADQYNEMKKIKTNEQKVKSLQTYRNKNAKSLADYRKSMSRAALIRANKPSSSESTRKTENIKDLIKELKAYPSKIASGGGNIFTQSEEEMLREQENAKKYLSYLNKKLRESTSSVNQDSLRKSIMTFDEWVGKEHGNQDAIILRDSFINALKEITEELK